MPPSPNASRNRILAGTVVVAGVVGVLSFDAMRQRDQTESLSRQWVGEQWDVARNCLLGTPIGRGESESAIESALEEQLVMTLATASEADGEPDADALWPGRCAAIFPSLRVDRSILRDDPGEAIATLDVLAPRVLSVGAGGPAQLAVGNARERARELAAPIATLDAVMPSGAEYDPREHAPRDEGMPASVVLDSLRCAPITSERRPFLSARAAGDTLLDELARDDRSARLTRSSEGAIELAIASSQGTTLTPITPPDGARDAVLWDEGTLLWLSADAPRVALRAIDGVAGASTAIGEGAPFDAIAICRSGDRAHIVAARGDEQVWTTWSGEGSAELPVPMPSPGDAPIVACDETTLVVAWSEAGGWRGAVCSDGRCEDMPPLAAGADLQLAVARVPLAVARGRRTDLPLARVLRREHGRLGWSDPVVVARGRVSITGGAFRIETCASPPFLSTGGRRWSIEDHEAARAAERADIH